MDSSPKAAPINQHLKELRTRLIISFLAFITISSAAIFYAKEIFQFLQAPFAAALSGNRQFIALTPVEAWVVYLKTGLVFGLLFSSPVWLYQLWAFIAPALNKKGRIYILVTTIISLFFFAGGIFVGYYIILPFGLKYLSSILTGTDITLLPQMDLYLGFITKFLLIFGLLGLVPIINFLLISFGVISRRAMAKKRPHIIVGAFVLAAIATPPDIITQIIVAIPLIILFEASLLAGLLFERGRKKAAATE